jgi:hypothetical protein
MALSGSKRSFSVEPRDQNGSQQWAIVIKHARKDVRQQIVGLYPSRECAQMDLPLVTDHVDRNNKRPSTFVKNFSPVNSSSSSSSSSFNVSCPPKPNKAPLQGIVLQRRIMVLKKKYNAYLKKPGRDGACTLDEFIVIQNMPNGIAKDRAPCHI